MEPIFCLKLVIKMRYQTSCNDLVVGTTADDRLVKTSTPFSAGHFDKGHHTPTKEGELQRCLYCVRVDGH